MGMGNPCRSWVWVCMGWVWVAMCQPTQTPGVFVGFPMGSHGLAVLCGPPMYWAEAPFALRFAVLPPYVTSSHRVTSPSLCHSICHCCTTHTVCPPPVFVLLCYPNHGRLGPHGLAPPRPCVFTSPKQA